MPNKSKQKGSTYEREIVDILKERGFDALRAWGSNGKAIGEAETTDIKASFGNIQCKRRAKVPEWIVPPDDCKATFIRADRGINYAVVRLDWLLDLLGK
jgi:hypothetical protein